MLIFILDTSADEQRVERLRDAKVIPDLLRRRMWETRRPLGAGGEDHAAGVGQAADHRLARRGSGLMGLRV
jgi:hypothetical protein